MKSLLGIIAKWFHREFRHPLADRVAPMGRDPKAVETRKWKQSLAQAHVDAARERRDAEEERQMGLGVKRQVEGFIREAELAVDRAFYMNGL